MDQGREQLSGTDAQIRQAGCLHAVAPDGLRPLYIHAATLQKLPPRLPAFIWPLLILRAKVYHFLLSKSTDPKKERPRNRGDSGSTRMSYSSTVPSPIGRRCSPPGCTGQPSRDSLPLRTRFQSDRPSWPNGFQTFSRLRLRHGIRLRGCADQGQRQKEARFFRAIASFYWFFSGQMPFILHLFAADLNPSGQAEIRNEQALDCGPA